MEIKTSNVVGRVSVISANPRLKIIPERGMVKSRESFKCWWAPTISLERLIDRLRCCQLRWTVSVVNCDRHSLSHWLLSSVYSTVGARHCVARQRQRRLVIRLEARLQPNIWFTLRHVLAVFTRSAITPPKVNRFGLNLEYSKYIVGAGFGRLRARSKP